MKQISRSLYKDLIRLGGDGCPLANLEDYEFIDDLEDDETSSEPENRKDKQHKQTLSPSKNVYSLSNV